jgi:hypothetical protein
MTRQTSTIQGETGIPTDASGEPRTGPASDMALEPTTGESQEQHPLADAGTQTKETAGQLAERAKETGFRQADVGREKAAEGLQTLAGNIRRISTDMETQQPGIANVTETVAEQTERLANYLRETDAREILQSVENAARKQPLLFMGGAFVIGLATARFLKAAGGQASGRSARNWRSANLDGPYALDSRTGRVVEG